MAKRELEILQREVLRQHGRIPVGGEGHEHHAKVRQDGDKRHAGEQRRAEPGPGAWQFPRAAGGGGLGHHGVRVAAEETLAERIEHYRAEQHDGDKGVGERIAANVLEAVENLHRRHAGVVEDERHAEVGERPDENDGTAGEEAGLDQRQGDPPEAAQAGATEIFGSLLHGRVDVGQCRDGVEVDDGVEAEGVDERDAEKLVRAEPVERPAMRPQPEVDEQGVERAILPEDLFDADGADEGRQDHRHEDERPEKALEWKQKPVRHKRQRQGDQQGEDRGRGGEPEGISQAAEVDRVGEQRAEVGEGQPAVGIDEPAL